MCPTPEKNDGRPDGTANARQSHRGARNRPGIAASAVAIAISFVIVAGLAVYAAVQQLTPDAPASQQSAGALSRYAIVTGEPRRFELPEELREVSGLAMAGNRLFAHQDERAMVFELDPASGAVVKSFHLGRNRNGIRGDFEGIAVAGPRMFLISSEGHLYEFREPPDSGSPEYQERDVGTIDRCKEIEGLEHDARNNELLLACKITDGAEQKDKLIIFAYSLQTNTLAPQPRIAVPLDVLSARGHEPELSPSGIAIHPESGTLFILASQQRMITEWTREGRLLATAALPRRMHRQPEGIAFDANGTLYIADEGGNGRATLTVYPPQAVNAGAASR